MADLQLLLVGTIGRPHGVVGELKVFPETDDPERFLDLERVFVGPNTDAVAEYRVESVRFQPQKGRTLVLLKLSGLATREDAEALGRYEIHAAQSDLPPLAEGEIFIHDMIGMEVREKGGRSIGFVRDVFEGAQLLLSVSREGAPDVLIPDVPEIVTSVDLAKRLIIVDPPEGLIE